MLSQHSSAYFSAHANEAAAGEIRPYDNDCCSYFIESGALTRAAPTPKFPPIPVPQIAYTFANTDALEIFLKNYN